MLGLPQESGELGSPHDSYCRSCTPASGLSSLDCRERTSGSRILSADPLSVQHLLLGAVDLPHRFLRDLPGKTLAISTGQLSVDRRSSGVSR